MYQSQLGVSESAGFCRLVDLCVVGQVVENHEPAARIHQRVLVPAPGRRIHDWRIHGDISTFA